MIDKINVRVYATALYEGKVLVLFEEYAGEKLLKLPGGGLEYGEGILDCLHREFAEELNVKIKIVDHLYTQEAFVVSKFRKNEQLLTVYYIVEIENITDLLIMDACIERAEWYAVDSQINPFQLPVDRIAFEKLQEKLLK